MNEEMQLRYFYFLTSMESGNHDAWVRAYAAWENFRLNTGCNGYEELIDKVKAFHKKYGFCRKNNK